MFLLFKLYNKEDQLDLKKEDNYYILEVNGKNLKLGWILNSGYLKRESDFFIATEDIVMDKDNPLKHLHNLKWAVFNGKTGERVTQYYDWISPLGLVKGQSEFFRVTEKGKEALFSLEGRKTEWFDKIRDRGALTGESCYFWGKKDGYYALYDINTGERLTDHFKSSVIAGAVIGRSDYVIGSYGN